VSQHKSHILAVDDDDRLRDLLKRYLTREGHDVTTAKDAASARRLMSTMAFDLIILDVMMPGEDGLSLLKSVREQQKTDTPVILLTARGLPAERIEGLKLGADDYLPKPFEPEELALRIGSILKRATPEASVEELKLSGMVFHVHKGELRKDGRLVRLTESETQLLAILAGRAGAAISRHELAVLTAAGVERSVDVQVTRLRRKIERDPREPVHLQTVRGVGYRLTGD
jgi:two-component system phosphate regulon response regulator OmpR